MRHALIPSLLAVTTLLWSPVKAEAPSADAPAPRAAKSFEAVADQTAAVIEGEVADITYTFNESDGPRTVVTFANVRSHLGVSVGSRVTLRTRGGPLPNGRVLSVPELPSFEKGKRYIVFLRNTSWRWSPILKDLALSVESIDGKERLISQEGFAVQGVGDGGLRYSHQQLMPSPRSRSIHPAMTPEPSAETLVDFGVSELIQSLRQEMTARGVSVHGRFYDQPDARGNWKRTSTVPADSSPPPQPEQTPSGAIPQPDSRPARQ